MKYVQPITRLILMGAASFLVGCSQSAPTATSAPAENAPTTSVATEDAHDHSGWWCAEHGVPEEECSRCDASLVAAFKERNDWCTQHERPDSQCFVCHPEFEAKFAARYTAKFGHEPPKPTEL